MKNLINLIHHSTFAEAEPRILDSFIATTSYHQMTNLLNEGHKFINIFGAPGTGKTTHLSVFKQFNQPNRIIKYLRYNSNIDLRNSIDVLMIDDIDSMPLNISKRLLNAKRIKQFIVASRLPFSYKEIEFTKIKTSDFNQSEIKKLIDLRLHNQSEEVKNALYKAVLNNQGVVLSGHAHPPRQLLKFLNDSTSQVLEELKQINRKLQSEDDEEIKIPFSTILTVLVSILIFFISQKNLQKTKTQLIDEFNEDHTELMEVLKNEYKTEGFEDIYITTNDLNLRNYPRMKDSKVIRVIPENSLIIVNEKRSEWWEIRFTVEDSEYNGWVNSGYLLKLIK